MGSSLAIVPLTTDARTVAFRNAGTLSVTSPLTVENVAPFGQSARPVVTFSDPFTVFASARPVVDKRTDPLTALPSASPLNDSPSTLPLTVRPMNVVPAGTPTPKRTLLSLGPVWGCMLAPH